jgi:hypothetical protein
MFGKTMNDELGTVQNDANVWAVILMDAVYDTRRGMSISIEEHMKFLNNYTVTA